MTRALLVLFFPSLKGFFFGEGGGGGGGGERVKNSNPKEKVGRSSSSAGSLVAICS